MATDTTQPFKSVQELYNANCDRSVDPLVMVRGGMGRDSGGTWRYLKVSSSGAITNDDAANFRISSFMTAGSTSVSAVQSDAGLFRVSALGVNIADVSNSDAADFRVSSIQGDAGLLRISSIGTLTVSGSVSAVITNQPYLSAFIDNGSVSAKSSDAATFRVSSIIDNGSISAKQGSYPWSVSGNVSAFINQGTISAYSPDASLFRVSGIGTFTVNIGLSSNQSISALNLESTAFIGNVSAKNTDGANFRISAILDNGSVSAKSSDAGTLLVSGKQGDAALFRVSSIQGDAGLLRISSMGSDAGNDRTSALQGSADLLRVSVVADSASLHQVSAKSGDAGLLRTSAMLFGNTTGGLTISRSLNVSTSFAAKAAAGAVYGWHAWNSDTKPMYIRLTNTSGAINVGTDVPLITLRLNASGAVTDNFPQGLKGFTAGIGCYATSVVLDNSTTGGVASAVGIDLYYI